MGFYSWECSKSGVSLPYDYEGDIVLVTPKKTYRGTYDGYGRINTKEGLVEILDAVGVDTGIIKKGQDLFDDSWTVKDKEGKEYVMGKDFKRFDEPIKDLKNLMPLFEGRDVNTLLSQKVVTKKKSAYDHIMEEIKLVVGYEYNGILDTFQSLKTSKNCMYQGFFYPEEYKNLPKDYKFHTV